MRILRPLSVVAGTALLATWFVSLAVHASVGAIDPVTPRFEATGGVPTPPPPLPPLVLPQRDPFAADVVHVSTSGPTGLRANGSTIASVVVPDPAAFARGAAASLGVIGVIVGDGGGLALVENGPQVQVVHVNDTFAGSVVTAINARGITLANGVRLDVDAKPSPPPTAFQPGAVVGPGALALPVATATPVPLGGAGYGQPYSGGGPPGGAVVPVPTPNPVVTPQTIAPGIAVPAPMYSAGNSLFPLLAPPSR